MEAFEYTTLNTQGKQVTGVIQADNEKQARQLLRQQALMPIQVQRVVARESEAGTRRNTLKKGELSILIRQLSTLIRAGLPLDDALSTLIQQADTRASEKILSAVHARVMEGQSLASALRTFPRAFDELISTSIEAGEQSGHLDAVLEQLADYLESREDMSKQSLTALAYPLILILAAIGVVTGLMIYVVPKVVQIFTRTQVELPWMTRAVIGLSDWISRHGVVLLIVLLLAFTGFIFALRNQAFRTGWHRWLLKMPLIGPLNRTAQAARFTRTLGILNKSSVPIIPSMTLSARVVSNAVIRAAVEQSTAQVREGSSLSRALRNTGQFPPITVRLIDSGEQSGRLSDMLIRAAEAQERDVNNKLNTLVSVIQPLAILFVGTVILFIVLAMLLPIFRINTILT